MDDKIQIKDLNLGTPTDTSWLVFQDADTDVVYKAPKSDIEGHDAYVYIAYADDASGSGFTNTFNASKNYIAILSTDTEIPTPVVGDFAGLWKKYKGETGEKGDAATIQVGTVTTVNPGDPATVVNSGDENNAVFNFEIPQGEKGACVVSVTFIGNDMVFTLEDSSTVTLIGAKSDLKGDTGDTGASIISAAFVGNDIVFTKDDATTVTLINGKTILTGPQGDKGDTGDAGRGIVSIEKTNTVGLVDTYTITYTDSTTSTFDVTNGEDGIDGKSFTPKGAYSALTEYVANDVVSYLGSTWIALQTTTGNTPQEGAYWTLNAAKGADGAGAGDMVASVYDPAGGAKQVSFKEDTDKLVNRFNGACQIPTITDNGDGSVTVGSGDYCLSSLSNGEGVINTYTLAGGTFSLTDLTQNYIVANYNNGTPVLQLISDVTLINETTIVPVYSIFRNGTFLHIQNWDSLATALANKIHQSIVKTQRYRRESGLALTESGTRNLNLTSGRVWVGAVPITLDAIASLTDNLYFWYHVAGVWTMSTPTQYNNTQYDNGTNLATLTVNRYAVNWIFRGVESQKHLYVVLGNGDYTLAQAQSATIPALPPAISSHAVLVGKVIVQNGSNVATSIQSAFDVQFGLSTVQSHGDLSGRDVVNSHPSGAISYDNTTSGLTADNVKSAIDELESEKQNVLGYTPENVANKKTTMTGNTTSDIFYLSAKAIYDWATGLFANIAGSISQAFSVSTLDVGNADTTISRVSAGVIAVEGVTIPSISSTNTLTNKRITKRITALTSHATPTINTDNCDCVDITALAENITNMSTNLSGTPTNKQELLFQIKDNGTARTISWGTSFVAGGVALPLTTVASKILTVKFVYNTANSLNKWMCVAYTQEA